MTNPQVTELLNALAWTPLPGVVGDRDEISVFATHEAVLQLGNHKIRVYQLSDGRRVMSAEDVEAMCLAERFPP